jgi:hypothetical protein
VVPLATLLLPSKIYELPTPLFALDEMNNQKENVCIRITIFFLTKVQKAMSIIVVMARGQEEIPGFVNAPSHQHHKSQLYKHTVLRHTTTRIK